MGRFFFHTVGRDFRDEDGTELADDRSAKVEAARVLAELMLERPEDVWRDTALGVTVTDDQGRDLFRLELIAATLTGHEP